MEPTLYSCLLELAEVPKEPWETGACSISIANNASAIFTLMVQARGTYSDEG